MLKYTLKYFHFFRCFSYSKINAFLSATSPKRIDSSVKITLNATNTTNLKGLMSFRNKTKQHILEQQKLL